MQTNVVFQETQQTFDVNFGEGVAISGGYDLGYADGYEKGNTVGYGRGLSDGEEIGYKAGYEEGEQTGYDKGMTTGIHQGYYNGYTEGEQDGYTKGHTDGVEQGYADGYAEGFSDCKTYGKTDVSMLPNFKGVPTETEGEFFYSAISNNGIWSKLNFIPFDGKPGATYLMNAKMKCGTADNIGIGFIYEDGTLGYSNRKSDKDYFVVSALSGTAKRVTHLGLVYGTGGSGYLKEWTIETMLEGET